MAINITYDHFSSEEEAIAEIKERGYWPLTLDFEAEKNDSHWHDFDSAVFVLEGKLGVTETETSESCVCGPGTRLQAKAGRAAQRGPPGLQGRHRLLDRPCDADPTHQQAAAGQALAARAPEWSWFPADPPGGRHLATGSSHPGAPVRQRARRHRPGRRGVAGGRRPPPLAPRAHRPCHLRAPASARSVRTGSAAAAAESHRRHGSRVSQQQLPQHDLRGHLAGRRPSPPPQRLREAAMRGRRHTPVRQRDRILEDRVRVLPQPGLRPRPSRCPASMPWSSNAAASSW